MGFWNVSCFWLVSSSFSNLCAGEKLRAIVKLGNTLQSLWAAAVPFSCSGSSSPALPADAFPTDLRVSWGQNRADISGVSLWYGRLMGDTKHLVSWSILQWMSETLILLESSAIFWYFLQKIYKKDFIFLNVLCDKCLFLSSYWGCLTFQKFQT